MLLDSLPLSLTKELVAVAVTFTLVGMLTAFLLGRRLLGWAVATPVAASKKTKPGAGKRVVNDECKMLMVVNVGLRMDKGKIAAQCCHACLGAYKKAAKHHPEYVDAWYNFGQTKVCVKVPNDEELLALTQEVERAGIPHYLVVDAGRTQIPRGSRTVLGIGPAPNHLIDQF